MDVASLKRSLLIETHGVSIRWPGSAIEGVECVLQKGCQAVDALCAQLTQISLKFPGVAGEFVQKGWVPGLVRDDGAKAKTGQRTQTDLALCGQIVQQPMGYQLACLLAGVGQIEKKCADHLRAVHQGSLDIRQVGQYFAHRLGVVGFLSLPQALQQAFLAFKSNGTI